VALAEAHFAQLTVVLALRNRTAPPIIKKRGVRANANPRGAVSGEW